jgi:hypothetical protein
MTYQCACLLLVGNIELAVSARGALCDGNSGFVRRPSSSVVIPRPREGHFPGTHIGRLRQIASSTESRFGSVRANRKGTDIGGAPSLRKEHSAQEWVSSSNITFSLSNGRACHCDNRFVQAFNYEAAFI